MEYRIFGKKIVVRLDKGDFVMESLTKLIEKENIQIGALNGLGATNYVTIGILNTQTKEIVKKTLEGDFEIGSLFGTITKKDGKPYIHAHIAIGNIGEGTSYAGHLVDAKISATAELVIDSMEGEIGRVFDPEVGLDIMKF